MELTWYGLSCFRMMERGQAAIVTDPYNVDMGLGEPNLRGDIVTVSHDAPGHNAVDMVKKADYILDRAGEYEIGGVFITAVKTYNKDSGEPRPNLIFTYDFGGYVIAHLGDLDHVPSQKEIEALGPIDVLLVPVGGGAALTSGEAGEVISRIEPSVVVPMHYWTEGIDLELDPVDRFLSEMGVSAVEPVDSLKVSASKLDEETSVVLLTRQG